MKKILSTISISVIASVYSSYASAVPVQIKCPLNTARVEMTSNLPSGWWRTPYVNKLKSTAITNVGGKQTLICKYGDHASFWTMHAKPAGLPCRTTSNGFVCNRPGGMPAAPQTFKTGPLVIPQTYLADLDYGIVRSQGADIWFQAKTATDRYITPRNGVKIGVAGNRSVNLAGCRSLPLSQSSIPLSAIPVGTYICVKTDQGRYSQFRVNQPVGPSPGKLHIGFTTWKK
jgi:hypothetical protein